MESQHNSSNEPTRVTFGFREGLHFGLGLIVPILILCLAVLGVLYLIP